MGEQSGDPKVGDELLDKLDQLFKRHRPAEGAQAVPTLAVPSAPATDNIPVLTDAVSGPTLSRVAPEPPQPEAAIENRLAAAIGREINRLQGEMPQHSQQLATLSATLNAAVRLLVRRYLGEEPKEEPRLNDREPRL